MNKPRPARNRAVVFAALLGVIALGLASRRYSAMFPTFLGKYPGDALWALAAYCLWAGTMPRASAPRVAVCTLLTSYLDEFSQSYRAPWIDAVRATTVGHLVLGSTFAWGDLVAYTVGVGVGAGLEVLGRAAAGRASGSRACDELHSAGARSLPGVPPI